MRRRYSCRARWHRGWRTSCSATSPLSLATTASAHLAGRYTRGASRTGWSGELGYEIIPKDSKGTALWDLCMEAGRVQHSKLPAPPWHAAWKALLSYCSDITLNDSPFTIGMDRLLDIDKPHDYVGKAALQAIAKTGPERRLVGANFGGDPSAQPALHGRQIGG